MIYNALMKRLFLVLALMFSGSLLAQAPEPVPLAHGNTPGEPHHHLKIENEYVRVYYVEVPPHENTQLHQHDHDYLFVTLGESDVINAVRDKPEIHLVLKDGETHFTRGGFAHVARNLADTPFRNITIELLKPQGEPQNVCAQIVSGKATGICSKTSGSGPNGQGFIVEPQLETQEMSLDLIRIRPHSKTPKIAVPAESLLVVLNNNEAQFEAEGEPPKILYGGEVTWIVAGSCGYVSNPGKAFLAFLELSFKRSSGSAKPSESSEEINASSLPLAQTALPVDPSWP